MYDRLLASGRAAPVVEEGIDSVHVTVERRVIHPGVIRLIGEADQRYQLSQRERIALGLLGQSEGLAAADLVKRLALRDASALRPLIARLLELGLVEQAGRTRATRYFVPPPLLRDAGLDGPTTLARIEPHRLEALIVQDLTPYPDSPASDVHRRIGQDVPERTFRRTLRSLVDDGTLDAFGERRWRRYRVAKPIGQEKG